MPLDSNTLQAVLKMLGLTADPQALAQARQQAVIPPGGGGGLKVSPAQANMAQALLVPEADIIKFPLAKRLGQVAADRGDALTEQMAGAIDKASPSQVADPADVNHARRLAHMYKGFKLPNEPNAIVSWFQHRDFMNLPKNIAQLDPFRRKQIGELLNRLGDKLGTVEGEVPQSLRSVKKNSLEYSAVGRLLKREATKYLGTGATP